MEQSKNTNLPSEEYLSGSPVKGNSSSEEPYEIDILPALLDYGETSDISDIESYEDVEIHKNKQVVETIHSVSKMKHSTQFVPGNKKQSDMFSFKNKNENYSPPGNNSDIQEGTPLENDNYITPYTTKEINFADVKSDSNHIKTINSISHHKSKVNVQVSSGIDHHLHVSKSCVKKQKLNNSRSISCCVKDNINPSERNIFSKESSESDTYSYKRKIIPGPLKNNPTSVNLMRSLNQPKEDIAFLRNVEELLYKIKKLYNEGKIDEALLIAKKYIQISVDSVQKKIFKELFFNALDFIRCKNSSFNNDLVLKNIKNVVDILHDFKLINSELCSIVICECLNCPSTLSSGLQMFSFCQKYEVPIRCEAINSYLKVIKPEKISLEEMVSCLKFIKEVCQKSFPKYLFREILNRFIEDKHSYMSDEFHQVCKCLCYMNGEEVDILYLQKVIQICIQRDYLKPIAGFICAWTKNGFLLHCLCQSFVFQIEKIGLSYKKLAEEIFAASDLSQDTVNLFTQIGVAFMLEASEKELFEQAFQILEVFNQNNMKYIKLQEPLCDMHYVKTAIEFNATENLVFPFTVVFAAVNACINLKKPKEAYLIFKNISLNLPNTFDSKLKLEVRSKWFHCLLRITSMFHPIEPLGLGREVLEHLLTFTEQGFSVKELGEYATGLQDIYNQYMISFLNEDKDDYLKQLYSHMYGPNKELLVLKSQVLRGLLIYFIRKKMIVEADKIFILGYVQDIYGLGGIFRHGDFPQITVRTSWTEEEIKFAILKFFEKLAAFVKEKPEKEDVDHLFSIGIQVKSGDIAAPIVNYLKLNKYEGIKQRICNVLKELDPNAQFSTSRGRNFRLKSEWAYEFWFQNYFNSLPADERLSRFLIPKKICMDYGQKECF